MSSMNSDSNFLQAIEDCIIIPAYEEMQELPNIKHDFSKKYQKKTSRLISDRKKSYYPLIKTTFRKVVCLIAAVIAMGAVTVAAVPAVREWFVGLFVQENEKNADVYTVQGDIRSDDIENDFVTAEPTYIPDGFEEVRRTKKENTIMIDYSSDKNQYINYMQDILTADYQIDTEDKTVENVKIGDCDAIISYDDETAAIVWTDGVYSYSISGNLCISDIVRMANSVNPTK